MNRKGFTLVEILVATALFLLAISTFSYLLKSAKESILNARKLSQALYQVQAKMEELRGTPFENLVSTTFAENRGRVVVTPALADMVSISVELEWNPKKLPIKLYSLRSKY